MSIDTLFVADGATLLFLEYQDIGLIFVDAILECK